ncbi:dimethylsulfone monooxygenase SfnG [Acinetobacter sp.]|uniref:dimethylsulfone monooxygenase SfnG n=1 Tax=Acinetobacter sp. TaxID=472 RepID=UPI00388F8E97
MSQQQTQQDNNVKFAYWVPNVSGGFVVSNIEQRTDWSYEYNVRLAQAAEKSGFEYGLTQIRFASSYGAENQHESVSFSHALLAKTEKIKLIAAILPGPWKPALAAKQLASINQMTNGRIAINVVSGWFRGEFDAIGEEWPEHDQRYARSEEFIRSLRGIWNTDNFNFDGKFYQFKDYTLRPQPLPNKPVEIFQGGSSRAARDMAASVSDWYFTNGNTPEELKKQIDDIREKAKANNHQVKIGVNAFIIARDTVEEAKAVLQEIIDKANIKAVKNFGDATREAGASTTEGEGNWAKSSFEDLVQYNDGFKTNLIGTPQQIAERILVLKNIGVDLVLSGFLHCIEEVEYFGQKVLPLVRELEVKQTEQLQAKSA